MLKDTEVWNPWDIEHKNRKISQFGASIITVIPLSSYVNVFMLISKGNIIRIFTILSRFLPFCSHREEDIVSFNDVVARIKRIDTVEKIIEYGGPLQVTYLNKANSLITTVVIINLSTGCEISSLLRGTSLSGKCLKNEKSYRIPGNMKYGPMGDESFWALSDMVDIATENMNFTLLSGNEIMDTSVEQKMIIEQEITKGKKWKFIQYFRWQSDLFACFQTSENTLVVIRMKIPGQDPKFYGTYLSSFMVNTTSVASVYFLPAYPEPIMYFSASEEGENRTFHELKLNIISQSDEGFQECQNRGQFPADFLKLEPYIRDLSKESWGESDCKSGIPLLRVKHSSPCFHLGPDIVSSSVDAYFVGHEFNKRMLTYIKLEGDKRFEIKCELSNCSVEPVNCTSIETNFESESVSNFWNYDKFTLLRWDKKGTSFHDRLLDCEFFHSCVSCTLYGGFLCHWKSSECSIKSMEPGEPCFSNVSAVRLKIFEPFTENHMELSVMFPYELNKERGDIASIKLDGKNFSNVQYIDGVYKLEATLVYFEEAIIAIHRGEYTMESRLVIVSDGSSYFQQIIFYLAIILVTIVVTAAALWHMIKKREAQDIRGKELNTSIISGIPSQTLGKPIDTITKSTTSFGQPQPAKPSIFDSKSVKGERLSAM